MHAPEPTDHGPPVAKSHDAGATPPEPALNGSEELLVRAAALAVERGSELEEFMRAAWNAFVDAQPGLRRQIEEMQLLAELERVRQGGRMALA
jgi:hypothetical protein